MAKLTISLSSFKVLWDFRGGPVVKNLLSNAVDAGSTLGQGSSTRCMVQLPKRMPTNTLEENRLSKQKNMQVTGTGILEKRKLEWLINV